MQLNVYQASNLRSAEISKSLYKYSVKPFEVSYISHLKSQGTKQITQRIQKCQIVLVEKITRQPFSLLQVLEILDIK